MMVRFEDWPLRLDAFISSRLQAPFEWGTNDCCLFACDGVLAITGTDPAAWFRGRYRTKKGAFAALERFVSSARGRSRPAFADLPSPAEAGFVKAGALAGRHANPPAARRLLEATAEEIAKLLGAPEVPPLEAQRGDVVLIETPLGDALALRVASGIACVPPEGGVSILPATAARRAWRV